ncbi:MAG: 16S rRNA (guanine(966)-N(2))-methyltransferase RsmD [Clostridia bacterium]
MRVITGKYRGRKLFSPANDDVRPTTDRVKVTMFDILQSDIEGSVVVDLFCGSGALGIECLSRGASEVVFVDKSRDSIALTTQNLKGIDGNYKILASDFLSALKSLRKKVDIIFLDPPFGSDLGEIAIKSIFALDILSEFGIIVYEHSSENKFELLLDGYKVRTKCLGSVSLEFISRKRVALVTGSFDPITKGHEEIIAIASKKFDEVVVACLVNPEKTYMFTPSERLQFVEAVASNFKNVRALYSTDRAVDVAKSVGAKTLVRGLRSNGDIEYEQAMAEYNRGFGFETMFINAENFEEISSTLVRSQIKEGNFCNLPSCCIKIVKTILEKK